MAKQPKVKCPYCGQQFYREDVDFVQIGRRYAHKECHDKSEQIHALMKNKLGMSYSQTKIERQIQNFVSKEGFTVKNIYNTLVYWYEIKKQNAEQANGGIGIVPYIYPEYLKYAQRQKENAELNKGKSIKDFIKETKTVIGKAQPITRPRHVRFYDLD